MAEWKNIIQIWFLEVYAKENYIIISAKNVLKISFRSPKLYASTEQQFRVFLSRFLIYLVLESYGNLIFTILLPIHLLYRK